MFQRMIGQIALCGAAALVTSSAAAQFFPGSRIDPCAPARPVASASLVQVASAVPMQHCVTTCTPALVPVAQTTYQTVPVTEYQPVKRTVQRPVVETRYVDQEVTAYRPITETRSAEVPTVNYHNVTEYQTVTRDTGNWLTTRECINRPTPCQYDPRPGLLGGLNRFGYSLRSAFTPNFRTRRQYVPNYVAQAVPVTRQVAVQGTRQVTYNVTRMEPYKTTRKVAVNSVRMVAEEVTEMHPVTVMRSIPTGTRVAYVSPSSLSASRTALAPQADPAGSVAGGRQTVVPSRSANLRNDETQHFNRRDRSPANPYDNSNKAPANTFPKDGENFQPSTQIQNQNMIQNTSHTEAAPVTRHAELWETPKSQKAPASSAGPAMTPPMTNPRPVTAAPPVRPTKSIPSIVRVSRWTRRPAPAPSGPALPSPGVSVAVD